MTRLLVLAALSGATSLAAQSPLEYGGLRPGMPWVAFERVVERHHGTITCGGGSDSMLALVGANRWCRATATLPDSLVRTAYAAVNTDSGTVTYLRIHEPVAEEGEFKAFLETLGDHYGLPDVIGTMFAMWEVEPWFLQADFLYGHLIVTAGKAGAPGDIVGTSILYDGTDVADLGPGEEPIIEDCIPSNFLDELLQRIVRRRGRVNFIFAFVIDTTGRVDPRTIAIRNPPSMLLLPEAVRMLESCTFIPAMRRGRPLRVNVNRAVSFTN